ncbi:MAG: TonB family protein [Candidatus Synoicihabitans palmerolidicus]|nr:TonB family protein [Candidatus Synoicihabitans palmerolidicus]
MALNLGVGDAMSGAFSFEGFGINADDTADDLGIFDIKDLDSVPRRTRTPALPFPPELKRARIRGYVTVMILIDERGGVRVEKVVASSQREFESSAIRFAESCQYEPPQKNGRTVRARYNWNIRFEP